MADLELRQLTKLYGQVAAVDRLTLSVEAGELVAFLGPSGCGKTTTLRMIAGFVAPSGGGISVRGRDITNAPSHKRDMGMVFQNYALFPHMTVRRNIAFGLHAHRRPRAEIARRVGKALELVGLEGLDDRYPRELSGGQQQRVAVARVLALEPKLLLFDEPLSNLDAKLRVQMRYEIRRLQKEVGITALFVTHDQEEAMTIADRIIVMNKGRVEQVGAPADIYERPDNRFVADFIGTSNFIEGHVVAGDRPFFRSRGGLTIALPAGAAASGASCISIRPEKIEIAPPTTYTDLIGTIDRAVKLGSLYEYIILLATGDALIVQEQSRPGVTWHEPGTAVGLSWRPEDISLLRS